MWNDAFAEHSRYSPNCSSGFLNWDIDREVKIGLCWREALSCSKCQYKSKTYKLYEELQCTTRGRRPAKLNRGLHIGLSQSSIGPASLAKILCSINTPPPSISGMQKAGNLVMNTITDENKKDMQMRCQGLRDLNILQGAQWLSGRVLDSRPKGSGFEPHRRHCVVVLEQDTFILA